MSAASKFYPYLTGIEQQDRYKQWTKKTEEERIANVLYPHLSSKNDQDTMKDIARSERRKAPQEQKLLSHQERAATSPLDGRAVRRR
jgi:hypothetical protein